MDPLGAHFGNKCLNLITITVVNARCALAPPTFYFKKTYAYYILSQLLPFLILISAKCILHFLYPCRSDFRNR